MWSLGVILYILLSGCPPFNPDRADKPLVRQVTEADYTFPSKHWSKISEDAMDLVRKLMTVSAQKRLSASETLQHVWLKDPVVVEKAERLMETQRPKATTTTTSVLNGILPEELEQIESAVVIEPKNNGKIENRDEDDANFKRPPCKRVKIQE
jgi:serine/threonine protein kinase